jgi:hypothetical protein
VAGATATLVAAGARTVSAVTPALFALFALFAGHASLTLLLADRGAVAAGAAVEGASDCYATAEEKPGGENAATDYTGKDEALALVRRSGSNRFFGVSVDGCRGGCAGRVVWGCVGGSLRRHDVPFRYGEDFVPSPCLIGTK